MMHEEIKPVEPDKTPIFDYTVTLSERDKESLIKLKKRNGAGMTVGDQELNIAVWKVINQVCEQPSTRLRLRVPDIEHPDWLV